METIYANSFGISTNGENEIFLTFQTKTPEYDEENKFKGMETRKSVTVIVSKDGYNAFRKMIDESEEKAKEDK